MRTLIPAILLALVLPALGAEKQPNKFPLKIVVLASSEGGREYKKPVDPCFTWGIGAPCNTYEDIPGWAVDLVKVTGRVTQRGRVVEYDLVCRSAAPRHSCTAMRMGEYPARWRGKRLEVLVPGEKGERKTNRFEVVGERDVNAEY